MGWQDRDYGSDGIRPRSIFAFLFGSLPLGTWFGIRVRIHATLILLIGFNLLLAGIGAKGAMTPKDALTSSLILFGIVLLHEFGHCFGARSVGGSAEEILLWPLGGLASINTPRRPWPTFVGTACGPLVNLIICAVCLLTLEAVYNFKMPFPWNPLLPFATGDIIQNNQAMIFIFRHAPLIATPWTFYVLWIYNVSWMLFIFNVLLPFYPMDGGRLLQSTLWPIFGYGTATKITCITGIIIGVLLLAFSIVSLNVFLGFIAFFGIMTCRRTLAELRAGYLEEDPGPDYSTSYRDDLPKRRKVKKGWFSRAKKRASQEAAERIKIDTILAKVHDKGLHSLTWREKRILRRATERQRQRDLAERL